MKINNIVKALYCHVSPKDLGPFTLYHMDSVFYTNNYQSMDSLWDVYLDYLCDDFYD